MTESLVSEYSRQIKFRIIQSLTVIVISFFLMFVVYERVYLHSGNTRVYYYDLFNIIPFILFIVIKEGYFRYNWLVKTYLILSLFSFLASLIFFEQRGLQPMFTILYPLCTIMYLNDRKFLFLSLYLLVTLSALIVNFFINPDVISIELIHLLSVVVITLLCFLLNGNIERIGSKVTFIKYADHKTNLPNRDRFIHDLYSSREKNVVAIINVDGFKYINDLHGPYIGDALLINISERICRLFPEWQIYRLSGSEFGLMGSYADFNPEGKIEGLIKKFVENSSSIINIEGIELHVGLSIGAAVEGIEDTSRKNILINTDIALQEAKRTRSKFYIYKKDNILKKQMNNNNIWIKKIEEAFKLDRFCSYYQPILCNTTGVIKKYECLARFQDEDGTIHSPKSFLPYLLSTKNYSKLTRTMINKCISTLESIPCDLSLNLSVDDLYDPFTMQYILLMLNNHTDLAHRVQFEILETAHIVDSKKASDAFRELKKYGCRIALDDFGSGYSNFEYLTMLNVDCIKIDGSLIQNICLKESSCNMVKNITRFCKDLGVEIIAEYVSDKEIYKKVIELGIDYSQGYYIGKPCSLETLLSNTGDSDWLVRSLNA